MKFYAVIAALTAAAGVSAQSPTVAQGVQPTSSCQADFIVSSCLDSEMPKTADCVGNDWGCLCASWKVVAQCYLNCPNDVRAPSANSNVDSYCRAASETASKPTSSASSSSSSSSSSTFSSASKTGSASESSSTGGASSHVAGSTPTETGPGNSGSRPTKTTAAKPTQSTDTPTGAANGLSFNGFLAAIGVVAALL